MKKLLILILFISSLAHGQETMPMGDTSFIYKWNKIQLRNIANATPKLLTHDANGTIVRDTNTYIKKGDLSQSGGYVDTLFHHGDTLYYQADGVNYAFYIAGASGVDSMYRKGDSIYYRIPPTTYSLPLTGNIKDQFKTQQKASFWIKGPARIDSAAAINGDFSVNGNSSFTGNFSATVPTNSNADFNITNGALRVIKNNGQIAAQLQQWQTATYGSLYVQGIAGPTTWISSRIGSLQGYSLANFLINTLGNGALLPSGASFGSGWFFDHQDSTSNPYATQLIYKNGLVPIQFLKTGEIRFPELKNNVDTLQLSITPTGTLITVAKGTGGSSNSSITTSADSTLTLSTYSTYVFTGSTATWTLPAGTVGLTYKIKNRGTGTVTLSGALYTTKSVTTLNILPGDAYTIQWDGTYYIVF